jgi:hypothetical protein
MVNYSPTETVGEPHNCTGRSTRETKAMRRVRGLTSIRRPAGIRRSSVRADHVARHLTRIRKLEPA